jgi:hypothetical protein
LQPCVPAEVIVEAVAAYGASNPTHAEQLEILGQSVQAVEMGSGGFGVVVRGAVPCLQLPTLL